MSYEIRIIKREANTNFDAEMALFDENYPNRRNFMNDEYNRREKHPDFPQRERVTDSLMTELSDEQYKKVKAEIVKVFE